MKPRSYLLAFALLATSAPSYAQVTVRHHDDDQATKKAPPPPPPVWDTTGWTLLGERTVDGKNDHDTIAVGSSSGKFSKMTVLVEDSDLEMFNISIHFGNGDEFSPTTRLTFEEGSRTRVIDLPGTARTIEKIDFHYGNLPGGGKARIRVYGLSVDTTAPPPAPKPVPPPPPPPAADTWNATGWTDLGSRVVDGKRDHDVIVVGAYQGKFDQLTFRVDDADVGINGLVVVFANGKKFSPKIKHTFRDGARARTIDLPGNNRIIKKILFHYDSLTGAHATIEVFGRDSRADGVVVRHHDDDDKKLWDSTGWTMLGEQEVNGTHDTDVVQVPHDKGDRLTQLTLVVEDSDLALAGIEVRYGGKRRYTLDAKQDFAEGSRTRVIQLPEEKHALKQVVLHYGNLAGGGRARVEVWGR